VADAIARERPDLEVELVPIRTSGDDQSRDGRDLPDDKSRFTREIELALLDGRVDLAVHSAKDVPGEMPGGLAIVAVPVRADPRDAVCVSEGRAALGELAPGSVVATSSLRRRSQILATRPDLRVEDVRGNVDTRLGRLGDGDFDALVLARAGLERLGRDQGEPVDAAEMVPAPGQGALALQARDGDERVASTAALVADRKALVTLTAERAVVQVLEASCHTPVGAHAWLEGGRMTLRSYVGLPDGSAWVRDELAGPPDDPAGLGRAMAARLLAAGAGDLLAAAGR